VDDEKIKEQSRVKDTHTHTHTHTHPHPRNEEADTDTDTHTYTHMNEEDFKHTCDLAYKMGIDKLGVYECVYVSLADSIIKDTHI
jgi:hypothetical protein